MYRRESFNPFGPAAADRFGKYGQSSVKKSNDLLDSQFSNSQNNSLANYSLDRKKIFFWWLVFFFGLGLLFIRVLYLQTFSSQNLKAVADGNRIRINEIKASRGIMYDRFGKQLVKNVPLFSLAIVPVDLPADKGQLAKIIDKLSQISGQDQQTIQELIAAQPFYSYQPVVVTDNLTYDQAIMADIASRKYPGLVLKQDSIRDYMITTSTPSLSHVLGYLGKLNDNDLEKLKNKDYSYDDFIGKAGLELTYEETLRGQKGKEQVEVDATGNAKEILAYDAPLPGQNLVLSIDSELQHEAEKALINVLKQFHKQSGSVIALDPNSGEVLALVNYPYFDNNLFAKGISQSDFSQLINNPNHPLFNRAISGTYPSGSTFKMVMASAALQEGVITGNTKFLSVGGVQVNRWFFPDWKAGGHGWTDVVKALAESVNTFFYIIGGGYNDFSGLGVDRIVEYAKKFGFDQQLGIDLPNESSGFLPTPDWKQTTKNEQWYIGDTYNLSIGQGDLLVSPLQIANLTAFFANGGTLYRPHVVKEIVDDQYNEIKSVQPEVLNNNFINPEYVDLVRKGLRQVTITGSTRQLGNLPIQVAAKTGTAQWSSTKLTHAWITAFAPYESPQIVVTVMIEEGGEGSTVGQPVAYQILNWWSQNR
ncbi:MAG: penicillin-binding protein 2 [Candidatus Buchananbacteria bacterium]|nr:penicillin-binding protein 2 [Candidatus Buchananbacteria bacterium]